MPPGFGYGDRFPQDKTIGPGPGAYDPKALAELGFKPDPKSGFVGSDRFLAQEMTGEAVSVDARPPSAKPEANGRQAKPQVSFGRSASSRKKANADGTEQPNGGAVPVEAYEQLQAQLFSEQTCAAKLHEDNALLKAQIDGLEKELGGKSKQVQDVQAQLHQVESTAGSALKELESTRRQLEQAQASAAAAQDRVVTLEAVCAAKEQAVEGLGQENRKASDRLAACEGQVGELQRQLRAQQASHEAVCKDLEACRGSLQQEQQSGAARSAEHEEQRAAAAALASSLEEQVQLLRDENTDGRAALEAAGEQVQQLGAAKLVLEQQLQGASALVAGLEQQLQLLGEESEQDQAALQEAGLRMQHLAEFKEGLEEQLRVAGSNRAEQQQQIRALEEEKTEAKAALEAAGLRARELDASNADLEQRLGASLALVANLEQQLELLGEEHKQDKAALEDAALRIQQLQEAQGELEQQLEDSEEGCGMLSDKLRAVLKQHSAALEDLGAAQQRNQELQQQHKLLLAQHGDQVLQHQEQQQQRDALQLEHSQLQRRCEELQRQLEELQQQYSALEQQHNALLVEHEASSSGCRELQHHLQAAQRHNSQLAEELATAQDTGNALANQAASLHAELQTMHEVATGLEGELSAAAERAAELQSTMDTLQTSHTQMQVALVDESQKSKQLAVELNSAKAFLTSASDETSSMREENYSLAHQVDKLRAKLEEQEVRRQELESMQQELASTYSQLAVAEEQARAAQQDLQQLKLQQVHQSSSDSQLQQELQAALERAEAMGREAEASRQAANEAETMVMEMHRLVDDNALLAERLQKMEVDLRELLGFNSNSLGHNNPRQKIQYHLRLKQELEELRHECILLLRDKFHLEQCVRYLAVRARLPMLNNDSGRGSEKQLQDGGRGGGGDKQRAVEAVQPDSLAPTHLYSTPVAQKEAKERARARRCSEPGAGVPTKEDIEKAIKKAQRRTMDEVESWKTPPKAARPVSRCPSSGDLPSEPASPLPGADGGRPAAAVPVEDRIMARIAAVCTPTMARVRRPDSAANSECSTPNVTPTKGARPPKGRK